MIPSTAPDRGDLFRWDANELEGDDLFKRLQVPLRYQAGCLNSGGQTSEERAAPSAQGQAIMPFFWFRAHRPHHGAHAGHSTWTV